MKRVFLLVPQGLTFDMLTEMQQEAINGVFGQYVMPMPGTAPKDGTNILDGVTGDAFDPANMAQLGLDWEVLGLWQWDGETPHTTIVPLDEDEFLARLSPVNEYDETGENIISTTPATLHEPHTWAGWESVIDV